MPNGAPPLTRETVVGALSRYWPHGDRAIHDLPVVSVGAAEGGTTGGGASEVAGRTPDPPRLSRIPLPGWGASHGVDGQIVVPAHAVAEGPGEPWGRVDWLEAAAWYLNGTAERAHERARGSIHSYAFRLPGWAPELWERAWVNRIALWLRAWAERTAPGAAASMGPLPEGEILLSHDVDAIRKTAATRLKQSAFHGFNAARHALRGELGPSWRRLGRAARFAVSRSDYWQIPEMRRLEAERGWRSVFNVFAGPAVAGRTAKRALMDPAYDPADPPVRDELRRMNEEGWGIGLHPSYDSWRDPARLARERDAVSRAAGLEVRWCRQHWLRFSWSETWRAQAKAGIAVDTTLGFNDRPGFRNGAALAYRPVPGGPVSLPLVVMDSHLHDYRPMEPDEREAELDRWLGEVRSTRGQASVVWHQRVLSDDYGWDYRELLDAVERSGLRIMAPREESLA